MRRLLNDGTCPLYTVGGSNLCTTSSAQYFTSVTAAGVATAMGDTSPDEDLQDFLDIMTYTCPFSGKKRCAVAAPLDDEPLQKKQKVS